ncbi:MAG: hypothetical protein AAGI01_09190 [Myxococcota bacterium]
MSAVICASLASLMLAASGAVAPAARDGADAPVLLKTQRRQRAPQPGTAPRKTQPPRRATPAREAESEYPSSGFAGFVSSVFTPPRDYKASIYLAGGTNFLDTAYNGFNPNLFVRTQLNFRPNPSLPFSVFGAADVSRYRQVAGPLRYTSDFLNLSGGAGLHLWYEGLRLDLNGELGAMTRVATQTDGTITPAPQVTVVPSVGAWTGMAFSIARVVALTMHAGVRMHSLAGFTPSTGRVDAQVLFGLEYIGGF